MMNLPANGFPNGDTRESTRREKMTGLWRLMRIRSVRERRGLKDKTMEDGKEKKRLGGMRECKGRMRETTERTTEEKGIKLLGFERWLICDEGKHGESWMISWRVDFIVWRWNGFSLALSGQSLLVERKKCYIIRRKTIDHRNTQLRNSRVIIVYSNGIEQFKFMREDVNGKTFNDCRNKIQMQD